MDPENFAHPFIDSMVPDYWCWDYDEQGSDCALVSPANKHVIFHPKWSNGTTGVKGTRILNHGVHYWEIAISNRVFGSSMMWGIATKQAQNDGSGYMNLIGIDINGYALNHKGELWHNGDCVQFIPPFKDNESTVIGLLFDGLKGTLSFFKDNRYLGVGFNKLEKVKQDLFPMISSSAAQTQMTLSNCYQKEFKLKDYCRQAIIMNCPEAYVFQLPLPESLKSYLACAYSPPNPINIKK